MITELLFLKTLRVVSGIVLSLELKGHTNKAQLWLYRGKGTT